MKDNTTFSASNEILYHPKNGWPTLILSILAYLIATIGVVLFAVGMDAGNFLCLIGFIITLVYLCVGWIWWLGLKVIRPNEALVLTLFGKYVGTIKTEGFFFINPFCVAVAPLSAAPQENVQPKVNVNGISVQTSSNPNLNRKISLKVMTHNNGKQKINDILGNPLEVGIIVLWRVCDTARAVFNVDNYLEYLSTNADSVLRDVVRQYPYDSTVEGETSLRESSAEISALLQSALAERVECAGLEIIEARITHLAYAPEIAAAMLQRQQATALIDARQKIVDGAVGMVQLALEKINNEQICNLDDERKAQMVSNLLVVLCGNRDAQPIVNTGSIY